MKNKELNNFINNELNKLFKTDYWGTEEQIENENIILNSVEFEMEYNETIEEFYKKLIK